MKIYVIAEKDSYGSKVVAYATSRAKVQEYLKVLTNQIAFENNQKWHYGENEPKYFKRYNPNVYYQTKDNANIYLTYWIEQGL